MERPTVAFPLLLCVLLIAGLCSAGELAEASDDERLPFLVRLLPGAERAALKQAVESRGGRIRYEYRLLPDLVAIRNFPASAIEALKEVPGVSAVRPDRQVRALLQESLPLIQADPASMSGYSDGSGITVCVLDTGIYKNHPAFSGALVAEKDFVNNDNDATDDEGHGTHVAGTVLSRDATYAGVAPGASLAAGKVLDHTGAGYDSDIIAGIDWGTLDVGAHVINMSLGGKWWPGDCEFDDLAEAVDASVDQGVVHVIAAGNDADYQRITVPACAPRAIAVGATYDADIGLATFPACTDATTAPDQITCYSNGSPTLDLVAPGSEITSTALGGGFIPDHGTSRAAAHVAGVVARLLGEHPEYTPEDVRRILWSHSDDVGAPGFDDRGGHGRVNALRALSEPLAIACGVDPECDDLDICTEDLCSGGYCERRPLCDDADPCNVDTCDGGTCDHFPLDLDDGLSCTTDSCDPCLGPTHTLSGPSCNVNCGTAIPLEVGQTALGDTTGGSSDYDSDCASGVPHLGPDLAYKVELSALEHVRISLDSSVDLGVYLLAAMPGGGDCDPGRCHTGADGNFGPGLEVVTAFTPPHDGEYYVIVDSTSPAAEGSFSLTLEPVCYGDEQGRPCDDHNACTIDDTCQGGVCAPPGPGQVPDGANLPGIPLTVGKSETEPGNITLSWGSSCGTGTTDYSIHEGEIPAWYTHTFKTCSTSGALSATIEPGPGNHYYLVVPVDAVHEGSYGRSSDRTLRPPSTEPCRPVMVPEPCPRVD
jgi:hypothetical protein